MKIVRLDQIVPLALAGLLLTASPLRAQPVVTTRARPVIAAGFHHTVALKADGTLWAWGDNGFGQLGIGAKLGQGTNAPAQIGTDQDWATVAVGPFHTLAVKANGTLWSWGANRAGQLGLGGELNENANAPARVGLDRDWSMVAAWGGQSLGLKTDGSLWAWGDFNRTNGPAQVGTDLEWSWMGPRYSKTLAVKTDGSLWELNSNGGIPIGTDNDWEIVVSTEGTYFSTISMSDTVALKSDGSLWTWGHNIFGQLGDGTTNPHDEPAQVGTDDDWATIAAAYLHNLAVKSDGSLWAWGLGSNGRLGLGVDSGPYQLNPAQVGVDHDWTAIAAGQDYSIGLKCDGSLWAWGLNDSGQAGLGELSSANVPTRIGADHDWAQPSAPAVRGEFRITSQSLNSDHSRTIFFTHTNARAYYILYRGDSLTNIHQPMDATLAGGFLQLTDHTLLASNPAVFYRIRGVPHTQPLDLDGDGIDDYYELRHASFLTPLDPDDAAQDYDGDGKSNLQEYRAGSDPTFPSPPATALAAFTGGFQVLKTNGTLWGFDSVLAQPKRVGDKNNYVAIFPGGFPVERGDKWIAGSMSYPVVGPGPHTLAVKRDGSLWARGDNGYGQLGIGSFDFQQYPSRGGNRFNWKVISAGAGFSTGIRTDGTLWAWGDNQYGQLGNGTSGLGANAPTQVGDSRDWVAVRSSQHDLFSGYSLASKADGSLWLWGQGEPVLALGDNPGYVNVPTRVGTNSDWRIFSTGTDHVVALKTDGSLWTWGDFGQDALSVNAPARIGTDTHWLAVAAGIGFSAAVNSNGTLWLLHGTGTPRQIGTDTDWGSPP